eukprot:CAMPEP_0113515356 /NCGR_PEP_ID=MMETSP0014_2-20120614/40898_1 /TAXON_ID=2857 /ORGANISM="Nitzschia sp." /LENGTH=296 /DNA_ID=CAMNT_0000411913 /DNA_START=151 /DNA_END=1041 /DNA_ORIENTATION=+ /assembly_acc=CAM_ASM_000159
MIPTRVSNSSTISAGGDHDHHQRHFHSEQQQQHKQNQQHQLAHNSHCHNLFPISPGSCDATTVAAPNTKKRQRSFANPTKEEQPQQRSNSSGEGRNNTAVTECMSNLSIVDDDGNGSHEPTVRSNITTTVTNHDMAPTEISATSTSASTTSCSNAHPPRRQRRQSYGGGGGGGGRRSPNNITNLYMLQHRPLNSSAARLGLQMLMYKNPSITRNSTSNSSNNNNNSHSSRSSGSRTHPSSSSASSSKSGRAMMNSIIENNYYPSSLDEDEEVDVVRATTSGEKRQRVKSVLSSSSW